MNHQPRADDNFSQSELDKFNELAHRWWDPQGPQKALHALNPARLGYVAARVPLRDAAVLDVGCGGGLLSEALAGEGARVTAIDLAPDLLRIARLHKLESGVEVDYRLSSVDVLNNTPAMGNQVIRKNPAKLRHELFKRVNIGCSKRWVAGRYST